MPRRAWWILALLLIACTDERGRRAPSGNRGSGDAALGADGAVAGADGSAPGLDARAADGSAFFDANGTRDATGLDRADPDGGSGCGYTSAVIGRVCAPEAREWVPGALVNIEIIDCRGQRQILSTTSGPDGRFRIDGVAPGMWLMTASAGAFSQNQTITVTAGMDTILPADALCLQQDQVRVAVVTGFGDRIETLLGNLGIQFDTFDGNSNWASSAAPFLSDLTRLSEYDLVFIDCAAATTLYQVDLGPQSAAIIDNLRQYVMAGGSLYASDWAVTFLALAFPTMVQPQLRRSPSVMNPFDTTELAGYAPQTIMADVVDPTLAQAIGASQVPITFPDVSGARSANWGLLDLAGTNATVLVQGTATTCSADAGICNATSPAGPAVVAPLAVRFKLTPIDQRGGNVFYTAFHNIAQSGNGVADILRWIVFHL